MKKTKEKKIYIKPPILLCLFFCLIYVFIYQFDGVNVKHALAATFSVYNHVTNDTFQYNGNTVSYNVDGTLLSDAPPGLILANGAAVGPYNEIFKKKLGASTTYYEGKTSFVLSYGPKTIKMTLGSTEAYVNGVKCYMNNAPFLYSFDGSSEKHVYVPTRFVAETFGFDYIWDENTSTASIIRTDVIYDGSEKVKYSEIKPTFVLNGIAVGSDTFTGYILDNNVFFPAEECFKDTKLASYAYAEGSGLILFKKGDTLVRLVLDSPVAYINDVPHLMDTVPRLITPQDSMSGRVYVPAEFVAKALGYQAQYQENIGVLTVDGTISSPENVPAKPQIPADTPMPDSSSYRESLFSLTVHEQIITHFNSLGYQVPSVISAYSCVNSDALYLNGARSNQIKITDKEDLLEIVVSGHYNPFKGKVTYTPEASFLNYCYFSDSDTFKIIVLKSKDLHYYTYSVPGGCVIHFTDIDEMYRDYLLFDGSSGSETDSDITDVFAGVDLSDYLPKAVFTRDHFVIRLPEGINASAITDEDEYLKNRFTISVPGNHMSFFSEQDTYNSIDTLQNITFSYKVANNTTVITFNTTKIQGYEYVTADGFLAVKVAEPKEIYDKIIVLDAGHGGIDPGTLRGNVYEKTVNFNVINTYAKDYFKSSDIKVYFTRTTDTKIALQTRADFAAKVNADLFISFHVNAHSNSSVNGTSVYYSTSNNALTSTGLRSSILASAVLNRLTAAWGTANKGVLTDKFVVIHNNTVPAVLVECGFITNNKDFEKIKDTAYQKKAAKAIYETVSEIFEKYPTNR